MFLSITNSSSSTKTVQAIRQHIQALQPGDRLPSSRHLMAELGVGPVTVRAAVARLVSEGAVVTRPGEGTFVAPRREARALDTSWQHISLGASPVHASGVEVMAHRREMAGFNMSSGYLDSSLRPEARLAAAMARAARRPGAWDTPPARGLRELRAWFAQEIGVGADDIVICPGTQAALSSVMRALVPSGSPVLFAVPTYPGALAVARSAGLVPVPVPSDGDGVRPPMLERALQVTGARLVYLQPTFANPDGNVLAGERRREVLQAAEAAGAFVIEDDWARWLSHSPVAPPPLVRDDSGGHVVTICSLTKVASPSLRIGAIAARGPVLERIATMRMVDDLFVARPLQEAAIELVCSAGWDQHLRSLSTALRRRMEALLGALATRLPGCEPTRPRGGTSLWLGLPRGTDDELVTERAAARGVLVGAGHLYNVGEADRGYLRLSVSSLAPDDIATAIALLAPAIEG